MGRQGAWTNILEPCVINIIIIIVLIIVNSILDLVIILTGERLKYIEIKWMNTSR